MGFLNLGIGATPEQRAAELDTLLGTEKIPSTGALPAPRAAKPVASALVQPVSPPTVGNGKAFLPGEIDQLFAEKK